jgi:glycosyltransferase involved in cell wall biosynthesis
VLRGWGPEPQVGEAWERTRGMSVYVAVLSTCRAAAVRLADSTHRGSRFTRAAHRRSLWPRARDRNSAEPAALIVIQNIPFALDRRVRSEAAALGAAGWHVSVICPQDATDPQTFILDGVRVYTYPPAGPTRGSFSFAVEFIYSWFQTARLSLRVWRGPGFDVLQACNPPDTYWLLGLFWKAAGVQFMFDQHDLCPEVYEAKFGKRGMLYRGLRLLERCAYLAADHVIVPNSSYQEVALRRGRVAQERVSVVMSTPDANIMRPGVPTPKLRFGARYLVCYVGIMAPQDGVDRLLRAAHHLVHVIGRIDCHFALLGYGDSFEELRWQSTSLGLDEYVTFTGRVGQAEVHKWLSTADVGVTPDSKNDFNDRSTMNKTLEYMAHEVPVVASDLLETRRSAGSAAVYVRTEVEMAQAIDELLNDPARRRRMGLAGRELIEGPLAWRHQAMNLVCAYNTLALTQST